MLQWRAVTVLSLPCLPCTWARIYCTGLLCCRSRLKRPKQQVVTPNSCKDCPEVSVGETKMTLKVNLNEQTSSETRKPQKWHCSSCSEGKALDQLGWCHSPKMSRRVLGGLWKPSRSGCLSWTWTSTAVFSFPWSGTQSWTLPAHIPFSPSPSFTLF